MWFGKKTLTLITSSLMLMACMETQAESSFDYSKLIHIDAENLCESGIEDVYETVKPKLNEITKPREIKRIETANDDYIISFDERNYPVYASNMNVESCWHNATNIFFHIVNKHLKSTDQKFYAFYGGNDLFGGFLTLSEVNTIKAENPDTEYEWPYLPNYIETEK